MKHMKKLIVAALAAVTAMALCVPALAFASTIEVQNVVDGETYTAYKILNYTSNADSTAVSYYLTAAQYDANADGTAKDGGLGDILQDAGFRFTKSADGSQYFVSNSESLEQSGVAEIAAALQADTRLPGKALDTKIATGAGGSATFTDLGTGYFFVTSTVGSLCALHSDDEIAKAVEKNTVPAIDKKEKTGAGDFADGPIDANIGDTVNYQIVITDGTGTDKAITMKDTMTDGLDYTTGSLKINGNAVTDDADNDNWKVTVNGRVITIVFKAAYVASVETGRPITVTYDATLNANAVIHSATGNENKVEMDYSAQHSEDKVYVETYDFLVKKTDGTNFLDGAEFKLYDAKTEGNEIKLSKDNTGYFVDATGSVNIDINSADGCNVRGLAPGTYYLEEVVVPDGYNKLAEREAVTITTGATAAVEVTVVNNAGTVLPSTGGIGTTIFYVIGGILIAVAAVFLITRKRVANARKEDEEI